MNKRKFIKNLGLGIISVASLSFFPKTPKLGYISVENVREKTGTNPGDWGLKNGDRYVTSYAFSANDITGEIEEYQLDSTGKVLYTENGPVIRKINRNFRFVYKGKLEKYKIFV